MEVPDPLFCGPLCWRERGELHSRCPLTWLYHWSAPKEILHGQSTSWSTCLQHEKPGSQAESCPWQKLAFMNPVTSTKSPDIGNTTVLGMEGLLDQNRYRPQSKSPSLCPASKASIATGGMAWGQRHCLFCTSLLWGPALLSVREWDLQGCFLWSFTPLLGCRFSIGCEQRQQVWPSHIHPHRPQHHPII